MPIFVTIAETRTGIVLNADNGRRHRTDEGDPRLAFDDVQSAIDFSRSHACLFPDRECIITDDAGTCLHVFRIMPPPYDR